MSENKIKQAKKEAKEAKRLAKASLKEEKQLRKQVKQRKKQDKKMLRRDKLTRTMTSNPYSNMQVAMREAKAYDAIDTAYIKCVFDPLNNLPSRIPSIFPAPTALFKYTRMVDFTVTATSPAARSYVVVCPWNVVTAGDTASNIPSFINYAVGNAAVPTNEFTVRIAHAMQGSMGDIQATGSRFVSFRAVSCAAQLECVTKVLDIQGSVTSACLMGPAGGSTAYYSGWTPSATQVIQHPFGYERAISTITESSPMRTTYFPLDPIDQIFHTSTDPSDDAIFRSPIIFVFDNITSNTVFRLKVTSVIEYLPTLSFRQWTDTAFPADKPRSLEVIKSLVTSSPVQAVSGKFDKAITNAPNISTGDGFLGWMKRAAKGLGVITDQVGGIPGLVGRAINAALD